MMISKRAVIAIAFALACPAAASAHVTLQPRDAAAGSYAQLTFTVPHGCDGQATTGLRIKIPEGVVSVKPQMKPGWTATTTSRPLATPASLHGKPVTEAVDEVAWRGGKLPDNLFDTFGLVVKLPDGAARPLYWPVVQECESVTRNWADMPAQGGAHHHHGGEDSPAPMLNLVPAGR